MSAYPGDEHGTVGGRYRGRAARAGPVGQRFVAAGLPAPAVDGAQRDAEGAGHVVPGDAGLEGGDGMVTDVGGDAGCHAE